MANDERTLMMTDGTFRNYDARGAVKPRYPFEKDRYDTSEEAEGARRQRAEIEAAGGRSREAHLLTKFGRASDDEVVRWLMAEAPGVPGEPRRSRPKAEPGQPATPAERGGFFNSIYKAGVAPIERIKEGYQQLKGAVSPEGGSLSGQITGQDHQQQFALEPYIGRTGARVAEGAMGTLNMAFPFGAAAGSLGGDINAWVNSGVTAEQADAEIKAQIEALRADAAREGAVGVPGGGSAQHRIQELEALLLMPHDERLARSRESASMAAEMLAGTLPAYSTPMQSKPKPRRQA